MADGLTVTTVDFGSMIGSGAAARELGISQPHLVRLVKDGKLGATVTPLGRLFDRGEVARLAEARRAAVKSDAA